MLNQVRGPGPHLAYWLFGNLLLTPAKYVLPSVCDMVASKLPITLLVFKAVKSAQVLCEAAHCWEQSQAPAGQLATPPSDVTNFLQVCKRFF